MERTWIQTVTLSQVDCDCLYFVLCTVGDSLSTLERWEPQRRFHDRWMVKTGFVKENLGRPMSISATSVSCMGRYSVHSNQLKNTFFTPSRNEISSMTLGSRLSCQLSVNMTYRVFLLQCGKIFCLTVNTKNKCL